MNDLHWSRFSRTALSVAVAIVAAAPALAQNTTAAVGGRVTTADGKPVAGATVVVRHEESGFSSTLQSDADGRYVLRGLRVGGPYTVTVTRGDEREVRKDIYLNLAETLALDLQLGKSANVLAAVVLSGSANSAFNNSNMGAGTNVGRKELDAYASLSRSVADYARNDPRLVQTNKGSGEISALGQNPRFNALTIDGVRTNDTFGLESNGLPTLKQPISIDAIQAVQVNMSNYDVTQQGYTGANINAVTKSGTNEFHGSIYGVYRDDKYLGKVHNYRTGVYTEPAKSREYTKGGTLGGPIIKDKLFFFANYEELHKPGTPTFYGPVGGGLPEVGVTDAQLSRIKQIAKDKYGVDIGSTAVPGSVETLVKDKLIKLDWNISPQHRASLRFASTEQSDPVFSGNNNRSLSFDTYWYVQKKTIDTTVVQWFADWTADFSTEFKVSTRKYDSVPDVKTSLPAVTLNFPAGYPDSTNLNKIDRSVNFGTEASRHFNVLRTDTKNLYLAGNWARDDHELKFGVDYESNEIYNAFLQNTKGTYVFNGVAQVLNPDGTVKTAGVDPIDLFAAGAPSTYSLTKARTGRNLEDGVARWTLNNLGLFLQDTWTINDRLTLTGGLRVDRVGMPDSPLHNKDAETAFGYSNTRTLDGTQLVQPRLGFNWLVDKKAGQKTQLRGGFGLFQGSAANVWLSNPYSNTGVAMSTFSCGGSNAACPAGLLFNPDGLNQSVPAGAISASNVDFLSSKLKQPSVWKLNLALEKELPWSGMTASAEWVHTRTKDGVFYRHLNLGKVQRTGQDGRELYYNAAGLSENCWKEGAVNMTSRCGGLAKAGRNTGFNDVLLAERTGQGRGDAITLALNRQSREGVSWMVAYTSNSATEVSNLSSSVSNSNWKNRASFNPNEEVTANSATLITERVNAALTWSKAFIGSHRTTVGLYYEGRKGRPYSWTYGNDMNGDGIIGNDLMYIPGKPGEVYFRGASGSNLTDAQAEAKFWEIVNANPELAAAKGKAVSRNGSFSNFVNTFDLRLSQEVPGILRGHKGVLTLDIFNVGNLLNKKWGHIDEVPFATGVSAVGGAQRRTFVNFAGMRDGKYVYAVQDPDSLTTQSGSQWALQITAKYQF